MRILYDKYLKSLKSHLNVLDIWRNIAKFVPINPLNSYHIKTKNNEQKNNLVCSCCHTDTGSL